LAKFGVAGSGSFADKKRSGGDLQVQEKYTEKKKLGLSVSFSLGNKNHPLPRIHVQEWMALRGLKQP